MSLWQWFDFVLGLVEAGRSGDGGRSYVSIPAISGHDIGEHATQVSFTLSFGDKFLTDMNSQTPCGTWLCSTNPIQ